MKVEGPGASQAAGKSKKSGKTAASGASFDDFMTSGASESAPAGPTHAIVNIDSLLAVQGAEDPAQGAARRRMRQRAGILLEEMDKIRMAMLGGTLTVGHMVDIADVIASHREKIADPALTAIMDEIDLRAQVELAKMKVALDGRDRA